MEMDKVYELKKGMTRVDVVKLLGEPKEDIGSGLYIYVYMIDTYILVINFDSEEKLIKATLKKGNNLEENIVK